MSVRIRLRRVGRKKQPYYRMVVAESSTPRDGVYLEEVGFYNPRTRPALLRVDLGKVDEWLGKGAEITDSAASLVRKARKGGDSDVRFVVPGEAAPVLKTATKPERRPTSKAVTDETEAAPEAAPKGGATDPLEAAAPEADEAEPAETTAGGETKAAVEAEAPKVAEAATAEQALPEVEAAAEAPVAEQEASTESSAEAEAAAGTEAEPEAEASTEAEPETETETEEK